MRKLFRFVGWLLEGRMLPIALADPSSYVLAKLPMDLELTVEEAMALLRHPQLQAAWCRYQGAKCHGERFAVLSEIQKRLAVEWPEFYPELASRYKSQRLARLRGSA